MNRKFISEFLSVHLPVHHRLKLLVLSLIVLLLGGCSSLTAPVTTWTGPDRAASETAILHAPSAVKIKSVNGKQVSDFLLENLDLDYQLLPGENRIILTHETLWSIRHSREDDEPRAELVVSEPVMVTIPAKPGAKYRFDLPQPESRSEAEAIAENLAGKGGVVNESGETVAVFEAAVSEKAVPAQESVAEQAATSSAGSSQVEGKMGRLEAMKTIWGQASQSEKEAFLRWAFE